MYAGITQCGNLYFLFENTNLIPLLQSFLPRLILAGCTRRNAAVFSVNPGKIIRILKTAVQSDFCNIHLFFGLEKFVCKFKTVMIKQLLETASGPAADCFADSGQAFSHRFRQH